MSLSGSGTQSPPSQIDLEKIVLFEVDSYIVFSRMREAFIYLTTKIAARKPSANCPQIAC
jgi:hypothetical protein